MRDAENRDQQRQDNQAAKNRPFGCARPADRALLGSVEAAQPAGGFGCEGIAVVLFLVGDALPNLLRRSAQGRRGSADLSGWARRGATELNPLQPPGTHCTGLSGGLSGRESWLPPAAGPTSAIQGRGTYRSQPLDEKIKVDALGPRTNQRRAS